MNLSAPIHELKRKAKLLSRSASIPLNQALKQVAAQEGYPSWGVLIRAYEGQRPKPTASLSKGYLIETLPVSEDYRRQSIELANHTFERVLRRINADNPNETRLLWDAAEYVDQYHLTEDILPIDSEYALSLIEAFLFHHVIALAVEADTMVAKEG
jgi:hypothetical protein